MEPPNCNRVQLQVCFQVAKVSRPLMSVSKLTEMGELQVLCKNDEAVVVTNQGATVARFARRGGFYVAMMKVKNPRFQPFRRQAGK